MRLPSIGSKFKGLADVAQNYHAVLNENRRLYNEVQDLKGNIHPPPQFPLDLSQFNVAFHRQHSSVLSDTAIPSRTKQEANYS